MVGPCRWLLPRPPTLPTSPERCTALGRRWSRPQPATRKALLLRVHAPGDFTPKSAEWAAWREGLQPHCRVSYWDVWDLQLAAGHKRFVVWVGGVRSGVAD